MGLLSLSFTGISTLDCCMNCLTLHGKGMLRGASILAAAPWSAKSNLYVFSDCPPSFLLCLFFWSSWQAAEGRKCDCFMSTFFRYNTRDLYTCKFRVYIFMNFQKVITRKELAFRIRRRTSPSCAIFQLLPCFQPCHHYLDSDITIWFLHGSEFYRNGIIQYGLLCVMASLCLTCILINLE